MKMHILNGTVLAVLCISAAISALPANTDDHRSVNTISSESEVIDNIYKECLNKDSVSCVKYRLYTLVDRFLQQKDSITVTEGVQIVKTDSGEPEGAPRSLSDTKTFESLIFNRVQDFLSSHSLQVDLKGKDVLKTVVSTARSLKDGFDAITTTDEDDDKETGLTEEGRQRKKKMRKMMGPMMMMLGLKMALLGKMALGGLAMMVLKALVMAKLALVLSLIIGLKKLLGQEKHVTYEVVAHPHGGSSGHDSSGGYGGGHDSGYGGGAGISGGSGHGGGWGRAYEAQQLAYKSYQQSQTLKP